MIEENEILRSHPLLSVLPAEVLDQLVSRSSIEVHPKGTILLKEGEGCASLYLILSGRCEAFHTHPHGTRKTVDIFGPGDLFGDKSFSCPAHFPVTVRVITDSVVQRIDSEDVQNLLAEHLGKGRSSGRTGGNGKSPVVARTTGRVPGRVVTLTALSQHVPDRMMSEVLAGALRKATGESVLLVDFDGPEGSGSLSDWTRVHAGRGGASFISNAVSEEENGCSRLSLRLSGAGHEPGFIAPLIGHFGRYFRYVLLRLGRGQVGLRAGMECMVQSDMSYLFLEPEAEDLSRYKHTIRDIRAHTSGACPELKLVVCAAPGRSARGFSDLLAETAGGVHAHVHDCPLVEDSETITPLDCGSERMKADLRRLAREIGRCRIGLALSSGGAKGLAHIGVIQVLEENGIEVDVVAGCSMGSYVASIWACGFNGGKLEQLARELEGRWGLWKIIDPALPPRRGFIHGNAVRERLKRSIGNSHFSDTVLPLRIVATHLDTLERVVFRTGEVAATVHASSAIPGVVVPVEIDGQTYVDGGVSDPLPIDVLQEMGVEKIIAVNTIPTPAFLRCCLEMEREQADREGGEGSFLRMLNSQLNYFARGNILDIMMRAVHGAQIRVAEAACLNADVVLRPLAIDARWHDFTNPLKYISLGRKVAEENLAALKALVSVPESKNAPEEVQNKLAVVA